MVKTTILPIKANLKLANDQNKDKVRQAVNALVNGAFLYLKALKATDQNEEKWNSVIDNFRESAESLYKVLRDTSADYLVEHL